ncbi:uncharacterized protein LOC125646413 isoform X2 [Ostrea edulis]|uniref:uncharacterized protein LOC125646413 isoform X2 n=1 Tax=Ostrea edulis TaxID=37623 RepID=UPI0024AFA430|nr:uncharacterized protein LOC125646413 isoform X2 [Ostrea edulis]
MFANDDSSKYGAPPSYEEATSNNPEGPPVQGYAPVQSTFNGPVGAPGVPPYPVTSEGVGGFTFPQYPTYPSSYPASHYPPQSGYPVANTTGQTCAGQYGQQYLTDTYARMRRRKIIFMTLFIFIMILVIFAITRWLLT